MYTMGTLNSKICAYQQNKKVISGSTDLEMLYYVGKTLLPYPKFFICALGPTGSEATIHSFVAFESCEQLPKYSYIISAKSIIVKVRN